MHSTHLSGKRKVRANCWRTGNLYPYRYIVFIYEIVVLIINGYFIIKRNALSSFISFETTGMVGLAWSSFHIVSILDIAIYSKRKKKEKRKRSDSVLWQKPFHRQKNPKSNVTTQRTPPKTSITQRLRTDLGRSAGVTIATQLVWLNHFTGSQPSYLPQKPCNQKDTHLKICK